MEKTIVLMSTYNGQAFLKKQLDSIFEQDYSEKIETIIRDDGSIDNTKEIISQYPQSDKRIITLIEGTNVGPQKSFLELIRLSGEADYYFFADQDDIWYKDKISRAINSIRPYDIPACYCSNYDIYNCDMHKIRRNVITERPNFKPLSIIFYNQIPGCVMGFNKNLMDALKKIKIDNVMMHDSMVLSFCACIGKIVYDKRPTIAHRIHGDNVVGEGHKKIIPHKWIVEKTKLVLKKDDYDLTVMADQFIKTNLVKYYLSDLILLRDYKKKWSNTFNLLRHPDSHYIFMDRTTLSIRCKILMHVF